MGEVLPITSLHRRGRDLCVHAHLHALWVPHPLLRGINVRSRSPSDLLGRRCCLFNVGSIRRSRFSICLHHTARCCLPARRAPGGIGAVILYGVLGSDRVLLKRRACRALRRPLPVDGRVAVYFTGRELFRSMPRRGLLSASAALTSLELDSTANLPSCARQSERRPSILRLITLSSFGTSPSSIPPAPASARRRRPPRKRDLAGLLTYSALEPTRGRSSPGRSCARRSRRTAAVARAIGSPSFAQHARRKGRRLHVIFQDLTEMRSSRRAAPQYRCPPWRSSPPASPTRSATPSAAIAAPCRAPGLQVADLAEHR